MFGLTIFKRLASNVPMFVKNSKILKHFDEIHHCNIGNEISNLRQTIVKDLQTPNKSFTQVDIRLCSNLKKVNTEEYLSLLNSWSSVRPDLLSTTVFYQTFLKIVKNGNWKITEWNHLIQTIYFIGHLNSNNDSKSLMIHFLRSVNNSISLPSAHYKDICIICEASFRTSTAISSPAIRNKITSILENLNDEITKESIWLVMLIKIMIFSKYFEYDLLNNLAERLVIYRNVKKIPFTAQCYILALFSNATIRHEELMNVLVSSIANKMKRKSLFRIKDVSMFLWAVSSLGYQLKKNFLEETVLPYLISELNPRNLKDGLSILIQCSISLWMLGILPKPLLDKIFTMESLEILRVKKKNYRDLSRYALLISILESEDLGGLTLDQKNIKKVLNDTTLLVPSLEKELEKRPELSQLCDILQEAGCREVRLDYPVSIYVSGVSGLFDQHRFHIDFLDKTVCLASSIKPAGRIMAKVRLLNLQFPYIKHAYVLKEDLSNLKSEKMLKEILCLK